MGLLPQLNSHAYKVYINSGKTHFYSNILAIFNPTIVVEVKDIGNGTYSTRLYGPTDLQKLQCPNNSLIGGTTVIRVQEFVIVAAHRENNLIGQSLKIPFQRYIIAYILHMNRPSYGDYKIQFCVNANKKATKKREIIIIWALLMPEMTQQTKRPTQNTLGRLVYYVIARQSQFRAGFD